jgi:hypothetical protein
MKVSFDFTTDDLVEVAERALGRSRSARSWRSAGWWWWCALCAGGAYLAVPGTWPWRLTAAIIAAVLVALLYPPGTARLRKKHLKEHYRERFGGDGPFSCEVELRPEGLAMVQAGTRVLHEWPLITAIVETPDSVDFVARGGASLMVRNRAFRSPQERVEFIRLARFYAHL